MWCFDLCSFDKEPPKNDYLFNFDKAGGVANRRPLLRMRAAARVILMLTRSEQIICERRQLNYANKKFIYNLNKIMLLSLLVKYERPSNAQEQFLQTWRVIDISKI